MRLPLHAISLALILVCFISAEAQKRTSPARSRAAAVRVRDAGNAIVIDEALSVLRSRPSLFAEPIQRMRRGRRVHILATVEADGVTFFKVSAVPGNSGWVQADAVFGRFRPADEERFARLVLAASGFDQIELASAFFEMYPASKFRPPILLMFGDLIEDAAAKLSRDATSRLNRRAMAASGAPIHSYYLNFNMLDRYRKLGVRFLFNPSTSTFHYDGARWKEIMQKYPASAEAVEARKRMVSLAVKLEMTVSS